MSPIVIRIGSDHVAILVSASQGIVVREIAWIDRERDKNEKGKEKSHERAKEYAGSSHVPSVEIRECFSNEEVEKRENWKEVAESDIEVTGNADVGVEHDEKESEVLSDVFLKGIREDSEKIRGKLSSQSFVDAEKSVAQCGQENKEERKGFFETKNNGEIKGRSGIRNGA